MPLLVALTGHPSRASATVILPLDLEQLSRRADRVLVGTVIAEAPARRIGGLLTTTYDVRVDECVKGPCTISHLQVTRLGGEAGGVGTYVPGEARLALHEEVLLFLRPGGGVVGMAQGKWLVTRDSARRANVTPNHAGLTFIGGRAPSVQGRPLDEVLREIRQAATGGGAQPPAASTIGGP